MKLTDFVNEKAVLAELQSKDRDGVVNEMIDSLIEAGAARAELRDDLIGEIIAREKNGSTGFGKGVAVPHVKHDQLTDIVATIGVSPEGLDFNALDKAPVYIVVMLLSPADKPDEHLQAMESIFTNLQKDAFRRFMRQATTTQDIMELLHEADTQRLPGG